MINGNNPKFIKSVDDIVVEMYKKTNWSSSTMDESFVNDLPDEIDVCGENGEYHSFVFDGPIFKTPIAFKKGEVVYEEENRIHK